MTAAAAIPQLPPNVDDYRLIDLFGKGSYDNLGEPKPWSNDADTLKILTILFMLPTALDYGAGQHMILLTMGDLKTFLILFYLMNGFFNLGSACIKLSLLFQYLRIFPRGTWIWRATVCVAVAVAIWGFTFSFMAFFPCSHGPQFNPLGKERGTTCWAYGSNDADIFTMTFNAHTVMNMIFDLIILVLPFQLYMNKTMTNKMRLGLLALLFMGALVNFLSIWRLQTIFEHKTGWYPTHDPTWYGPISILLGVLEINVASICASVPIFWPVVAPYLGSIFVTHEVSVQVVEYRDLESPASGGHNHHPGSGGNKQQQLHHQRSDSEIRLNALPFPADRKNDHHHGGGGEERKRRGSWRRPSWAQTRPASTAGRRGQHDGWRRRGGPLPKGHARVGSSQSRVRSDSVRRKDKWYQI
ncbi:hypothetical protein PG997_009013 [Apiospora hydei]|uniref:Rhodopsin domain-containing protein n=1 Tax=Apiospora hydei TaxID=1337664 RepID=A0ABR1WCG5_9PEZI